MIKAHYYDLIKKPIITEKATALSENNKYVFQVPFFANKSSIKSAITKIFEVEVKKVNIINLKGKVKRFRGHIGRQSDIKKAIVTLKPGSNIDFVIGGSK